MPFAPKPQSGLKVDSPCKEEHCLYARQLDRCGVRHVNNEVVAFGGKLGQNIPDAMIRSPVGGQQEGSVRNSGNR
jgi:hypothetical protein